MKPVANRADEMCCGVSVRTGLTFWIRAGIWGAMEGDAGGGSRLRLRVGCAKRTRRKDSSTISED